jgi:hypothetical protein
LSLSLASVSPLTLCLKNCPGLANTLLSVTILFSQSGRSVSLSPTT